MGFQTITRTSIYKLRRHYESMENKIMEQIIVVEQELELLKRIVKEKEDALFCLKCEFVDEKDS